jgi:hypothetical protein
MTGIIEAGKCRVCGCTEFAPCHLKSVINGESFPCSWVDANRTLCSNPRCTVEIPMEELLAMI